MEPSEYTAEQLIASLKTAGLAPGLDLLRDCLDHEEALRPHLLEMLANNPYEKYGLPPDSEDPRSVVDIHAGHLLLAFKEPAALPLFAEVFRDEEREHLVEWFTPWLHEYGMAAVAPFVAVVGDEDVYWFGRAGATEVLSAIGRRFPETRDEIITRLQELLPTAADGDPLPPAEERDEIWTWIAMALSELNAEATLSQVRALYEADLMVEKITGDLDEYLARYGEASREPRPFNLLDTYRYLHRRVEQEEARKRAERAASRRQVGRGSPSDEYERSAPGEPTVRAMPKVGRNEPCPCGSGRKYKHCHGRPGH